MRSGSIVVGIGHPDRGDDAVGLSSRTRLRGLVPDGVTVLSRRTARAARCSTG